MSDLSLKIPLHKMKDVAHNLDMARGLICKCAINPIFKKSILSLMNDAISVLQDSVKVSEKNAT